MLSTFNRRPMILWLSGSYHFNSMGSQSIAIPIRYLKSGPIIYVLVYQVELLFQLVFWITSILQRQHSTLDLHLKDLKSELSKVFANVLSTEVSSENFNETFNKLSVAITGKNGNKRGCSDGITTKLKRHLKQARIDTVAL